MKKQNLIKSILYASAITVAVGCAAKNESSSSSISTSVVMTGAAGAQVAQHKPKSLLDLLLQKAVALMPSTLVDSTNLNITMIDAWVSIKSIKFKAEEVPGVSEVDTEDSIKFKGPYYVDLLSNAPSPIDTQLLPAGSYKRIEFDLHKVSETLPANAPAALANNSLYFKFNVNGHTVTWTSEDGAEIQIAGPKGLNLDGSNVLISLRMVELFSKIDLSSIASDVTISESSRINVANACPLIESSAQDLYTCFRKGLEQEAKCGKDADGSGEIESSEDEVDDNQ